MKCKYPHCQDDAFVGERFCLHHICFTNVDNKAEAITDEESLVGEPIYLEEQDYKQDEE